MPLGMESGCLMLSFSGDTLQRVLLGCRLPAADGLLGYLNTMLLITEYVATFTLGCSFPPPAGHRTCRWPGGHAKSQDEELSTRDVAIRCSTCFLWKPMRSVGDDVSWEWLKYSLGWCFAASLSSNAWSPTLSRSSTWQDATTHATFIAESRSDPKSRQQWWALSGFSLLCFPMLEAKVGVKGVASGAGTSSRNFMLWYPGGRSPTDTYVCWTLRWSKTCSRSHFTGCFARPVGGSSAYNLSCDLQRAYLRTHRPCLSELLPV